MHAATMPMVLHVVYQHGEQNAMPMPCNHWQSESALLLHPAPSGLRLCPACVPLSASLQAGLCVSRESEEVVGAAQGVVFLGGHPTKLMAYAVEELLTWYPFMPVEKSMQVSGLPACLQPPAGVPAFRS